MNEVVIETRATENEDGDSVVYVKVGLAVGENRYDVDYLHPRYCSWEENRTDIDNVDDSDLCDVLEAFRGLLDEWRSNAAQLGAAFKVDEDVTEPLNKLQQRLSAMST